MIISEQGARRAPLHTDPEVQIDDGARIGEYTRWRTFANGKQYPGRPPQGSSPFVANYARALVRKVASYVFPSPVSFDVGAVTDEDNRAEVALGECLQALDAGALDIELEIERAIIGDAAVKVTWDPETAAPLLVSVDPAQLVAAWSPANPREPVAMTHTYQLPGWALLSYGVDLANDNALHTVTESWTSSEWRMAIAGTTYDVTRPNPYGWIPYVVIPNDPHPRRFWGRSDLIDIEPVCMELNHRLSTIGTILELSGAPIAVLENVDGSDGISVRPGAKWELPEGAKAYLLDLLEGQGVRLHIEYISEVRTTLHDLSETPRTAFGDTGRPLSGAALEVEIQPLVQRVMRKRAQWMRFYRERNRRLLDLLATFGGEAIGPDRLTSPIWSPILPNDDDSMTSNEVALVAAGIRSRRSAASRLGETDPDNEWERVLAEREAMDATDTPQTGSNAATGQ